MSKAITRLPTIRDLVFGGAIIAIVYFLALVNLPSEVVKDPSFSSLFWIAGIVWALINIHRGFDVARILFSFSWSFISIIGFIYIFFIVILGFHGLPYLFALFIWPIVAIALAGYLKIKIVQAISAWRVRKASRVKVEFKKRVRTAFFKIDPVMVIFIVVSVIVLTVFLLVPVFMMLEYAFEVPKDQPFYYWFTPLFTQPPYIRLEQIIASSPWYVEETEFGKTIVFTGVNYGILLNSLVNAAIVSSVATILGILVAFVFARYDFPGKTFFRILATVPLFITPFVNAYIVKNLFSEVGPISFITNLLFGYSVRIQDLAGIAVAQIMAFYPIVYLNAYSSFINIDPSMEEQAENLGAKGLRLFFTVTLPLALPGIAAGSVLVFIFSLEDLGAPIVFNYPDVISYKIFSSLTSEVGIVDPSIAALGVVLLGLAIVGFIAIRSYVGMRSYAMISRGGRWNPRITRVGIKGLLVIYLLMLPLIIFTAMPQIGVALLAFDLIPAYGFHLQPEKFTTEYFVSLFTNPDIFKYVRNTITYALSAVALAVLVALITAYVVSRTRIKLLTPALDTLATIPIAIPGLVIALGYFRFYSTVFSGTPVDPTMGTAFQAWIVLIIAYSIRKLPFVARSIYAGFQQVHEALEEAALNLGAKRLKTIISIVLPLILTNIVSGALIGFIYISTEVSTSVTLGSFNPDQAPMTYYMMNIYKGGTVKGVQYVAAMGLLLIIFQLIAVTIVTIVFKQRYAFIGI